MTREVKQVAFADDLRGAGKLEQLRYWWDNIVEYGSLLGYHPRADKSWLIVKPDLVQQANHVFSGTDVRITCDGHKYLGGFTGSVDGKNTYVHSLVDRWCRQLHQLSKIAKHEPQAAYAAFVSGFRNRFTYHLRTIPGLEDQLQEIDDIIDNVFLPAFTEYRSLSLDDRKLLSVPTKMGGLGIPILTDMCTIENDNSKKICESLVENIIMQNNGDINSNHV